MDVTAVEDGILDKWLNAADFEDLDFWDNRNRNQKNRRKAVTFCPVLAREWGAESSASFICIDLLLHSTSTCLPACLYCS